MTLFDEVLPLLLDQLDLHGLFAPQWRTALVIIVVRDPAGRVRLVFDERGCAANPLGKAPIKALEASLEATLGAWFMAPILATASCASTLRRKLAQSLVEHASLEAWPASWPLTTPAGVTVSPANLKVIQRFQGAQSWLIAETPGHLHAAPWPIADGPKILAFYSFKGGVGRTTSLAIMAERFARAGKRVACIDLDLEAPGLADFLELSPIHGVVDALLSHAIHDELPAQLDDWWLTPALVPKLDDPTRLRVLAAGRLDAQYLDKLARLDLAMQDPQSVAAASLAALLEDTRTRHGLGPDDLIFIDCRAGLHELAGIALKRLSHLQVLVARRSAQNLSGLRIAMAALAPRILDDERLLLLQTFVPIAPDARERELVAFRQSVLEIIQDEVIYKGQDVPQLEDEGVHKALSIPFYNTIIEVGSLQEVERSTKENETFDAIQEKLEELMR